MQVCYCSRRSVVQVGAWLVPVFIILLLGPMPFVCVYALLAADTLWDSIFLAVLFGVLFFGVFIWEYTDNKKEMARAGHSRSCSRRMAMLSVMYLSRGSHFVVLTPKEERMVIEKRADRSIEPHMDYTIIAVGVWVLSFLANSYFLAQFIRLGQFSAYGIAFLLCSLCVSIAMLAFIPKNKATAIVFNMANAYAAAALLAFYVAAACFVRLDTLFD